MLTMSCGLIPPFFSLVVSSKAADQHYVCNAIPQTFLRWRCTNQKNSQEIRDGVGEMIDDTQQIAKDGSTPAYGRAIQLEDTYANAHVILSGGLRGGIVI